jgi:hypothetical protein
MKALHYTTRDIKVGDTIISSQSKGKTYNLVWEIYNQVCLKINKKSLFPDFGYAYPSDSPKVKLFTCTSVRYTEYVVEAKEFIEGNLDHSIYVCMDKLSFFMHTFKGLTLAERLEKRAEFIKNEALKYFDIKNAPLNKRELIGNFVVISKSDAYERN